MKELKEIKESLKKLFEGFGKFLNDFFFYFLNASIDAKKDLGWKGYLFLIPVILAILILLYSIIRIMV